MLPALPSRENNNKISSNRTPTPTSRHTNMFPAPTRHSSPHQTAVAWFGSDSRVTRTHHESHQDEAVGGGGEGGGDEVPINRWVSSVRELCEGCCAMRTGVGARRGSKCERCGRTACRGFAQKKAHTTRTNGAAGGAGPVPWQQLSKVRSRMPSGGGEGSHEARLSAMFCGGLPCWSHKQKSRLVPFHRAGFPPKIP